MTRIAVLLKPVPETTGLEGFGPDLRVNRTGAADAINPYDEYALEAALRLVEGTAAEIEIVLVSMAPTSIPDPVRKGLAMGAHRAVVVSDPLLQGSDTLSTTRVLAAGRQRHLHPGNVGRQHVRPLDRRPPVLRRHQGAAGGLLGLEGVGDRTPPASVPSLEESSVRVPPAPGLLLLPGGHYSDSGTFIMMLNLFIVPLPAQDSGNQLLLSDADFEYQASPWLQH